MPSWLLQDLCAACTVNSSQLPQHTGGLFPCKLSTSSPAKPSCHSFLNFTIGLHIHASTCRTATSIFPSFNSLLPAGSFHRTHSMRFTLLPPTFLAHKTLCYCSVLMHTSCYAQSSPTQAASFLCWIAPTLFSLMTSLSMQLLETIQRFLTRSMFSTPYSQSIPWHGILYR